MNAGAGLAVDRVAIAYGGNRVVDDVSFDAPAQRITGLIGPNGAGKTSIFNVCSGLVRAAAGTVRWRGVDLAGCSPARRADVGIGRTFQAVRLCPSLTVAENVSLGPRARSAGRRPWRQVLVGRATRSAIAGAVDEAIERCHLQPVASTPLIELPTGARRMVELARALAAGFELLLLDEPSSGLDDQETAAMGTVLRDVSRDRSLAILLVEHDMSLVMGVCETIHVLDFGRIIFSGAPADVQASPAVQAAYLGIAEPA